MWKGFWTGVRLSSPPPKKTITFIVLSNGLFLYVKMNLKYFKIKDK